MDRVAYSLRLIEDYTVYVDEPITLGSGLSKKGPGCRER